MSTKLIAAVVLLAAPITIIAGIDGDDCADAISFGELGEDNGSTVGASVDDYLCSDDDGPSVWYTVTGSGAQITATTCFTATDFDTRLAVYCGGCDGLECITENDDTNDNGCTTASTVTWCGEPGRVYHIQVSGAGGQSGFFNLRVSLGSSCNEPDGCSSAPFDAGCLWEQFPWDGEEGQSSESGTAIEESRTADEFCLKEGFVHRIDCIYVEMLSNSEEFDATLQLYHDCNGCPGDLVDCGFFKDPEVEVIDSNVVGDLDLVRFKFNTGPREHLDEYGELIFHPGLWLKGGCYWASPVGIGDGTGYDRYLWCTSSTVEVGERGRPGEDYELIGAIPKTQVGELKVGPDFWEQVSNINVGCRNFCFKVEGESCCLVLDSGGPAADVEGAVDTTNVDCFNSDNFLIPPCSRARELCFFSAYIWTNCDCERTKIQILPDECLTIDDRPVRRANLTDFGASEFYEADKCVQLTGFGSAEGGVDFEGQALALYRVEFHDLDIPVGPGENYWVSLHVQGTGSFNERGVWAFNASCENPDCLVNISPAQAICPSDGVITYTELERDHAFCIGVSEDLKWGDDEGSDASSSCVADMDGNGSADVADLITFLGFWFEGCEE